MRAHRYAPTEDDWRARVLAVAERAARAGAPGSLAAVVDDPDATTAGQVVVLAARRRRRRVVRARAPRPSRASCTPTLHGFTFAVGHSRAALGPGRPLPRRQRGAAGGQRRGGRPDDRGAVLAFEDTGAYRLLLPAMSEDPAELQRFYAETVEPLVAYDEQYETDLVQTLETFLDCDGNVAGTAQRLFTHRHTIRYRLERVRELSGLDVGSTDGREKLGLGLKAMRVLGIAAPARPRHRGRRRAAGAYPGGRRTADTGRRFVKPPRMVAAAWRPSVKGSSVLGTRAAARDGRRSGLGLRQRRAGDLPRQCYASPGVIRAPRHDPHPPLAARAWKTTSSPTRPPASARPSGESR